MVVTDGWTGDDGDGDGGDGRVTGDGRTGRTGDGRTGYLVTSRQSQTDGYEQMVDV